MSLAVTATSPGDIAAVTELLSRIFSPGAVRGLVAPQHMHWKYWSTRAGWSGSRGFAATHGGTMVAHAGAWPVRIRVHDADIPAAHLIDWASDPGCPGAGVWLLRQIRTTVPVMIATGGSELARQVLPVVGFRPRGEVSCFARSIRPLRQVMTDPSRSWRLPARLMRNTFWLLPPLSVSRDWSAYAIAPSEMPAGVWPEASPSTAVMARDADVYRYMTACPSVPHLLFVLEKGAQAAGYFCLAFAPHVARIADLWLRSTSVEDWSAAFTMAALIASRAKDICEVSVWASTTLARHALVHAGFRLRDRAVLSVLGDGDRLDGRELHVQMLDCDASFVAADVVSYLT